MALSGSTDYSLNARDVVYHALRKAGVSDHAQTPELEDVNIALKELEMMLKHWQIKGPFLHLKREANLALTQSTESYSLPTETMRIISARVVCNSSETSMNQIARTEYFDLPVKNSTGYPTNYYFDAQRGAPTLYVWPTASDGNFSLKYTYQKRIDDIDNLNNDLEIPQEHLLLVTTCLADRIARFHQMNNQELATDAVILMNEVKDYDREPHVQFIAGCR